MLSFVFPRTLDTMAPFVIDGRTVELGVETTPTEGWWGLLAMWAGALLGWLVSPALWLVWPPLRWCAALAAMAAAESSFDTMAVGDQGKAVGILQFHEVNAAFRASGAVAGADSDWRGSAFWSGFYASRWVSSALMTSPSWWTMAIPGLGFAVLRVLWLRGESVAPWSGTEHLGVMGQVSWDTEKPAGRAWVSWLVWRPLSLVVLLVPLFGGAWAGLWSLPRIIGRRR